MARLVPIQYLARSRERFAGPHLSIVLGSILAGNTGGQLWEVPRPGALPLLLLWDKGNNVLYIAGDEAAPEQVKELADVVARHVRPEACAEGASYFKTRPLSGPLEAALPQIFPDIALRPYPTLFYTYESATPPVVARPAAAGLVVVPIDRAVLLRAGLANSDKVRDEIRWMWPSEEAFHERGFGTLAVIEGQIVCWCTAEYVGPTHCGIGISTVPAYERQGVATATAAAFVEEARQRGLIPCWECGSANAASVRVAEKLGFVRRVEERYWLGSFAS